MSDHCPRCNAHPETVRTGALVSLKCAGCGAAFVVLPRVPDGPTDWDERFIGQRCGNCHLVSRVAVEEDGPVYEALHFGLNQPVHVKVLAPDLVGDASMVQRFVRQAQLAAKVVHPRVPRILDIGPSQDVPYVIRERTQGQRLSAKLSGSPFSVEEASATISQIAEALSAVHDAGIVHLNVKPHSIIVSESGDIHLVGFSAAIRQAERPQLIAGSLGYAAGEQITGKELGPPADIFALGLLFHELLTGKPAFTPEADAAGLAMPADLRIEPSLPQRLAGLIQRMTRRSTVDRIASCARVLQDLRPEPQPETPVAAEPEAKSLAVAPTAADQALSQTDLEALFEPGAATSPQPGSAVRPAAFSSALTAGEDLLTLMPVTSATGAQPAGPQAEPPETAEPRPGPMDSGARGAPSPVAPKTSAGPASSNSSSAIKIRMQCPQCGVVVRGASEVFAKPIRCPQCNGEAVFKPVPKEAAQKPAAAPAAEPAAAAPLSSTGSGKIHMQCPKCGLVVRGYPYVFVSPIRCPDCKVESLFKPEAQETAPKPDEKSGSSWKKWGSALLKRRSQGQEK